MTYNEWRDELKNNLLCVSEAERRRVLDYYAEAYADRRDAGFSEREIINEFGAPYDAAQKILYENSEGTQTERSAREIVRSKRRPTPFRSTARITAEITATFRKTGKIPFRNTAQTAITPLLPLRRAITTTRKGRGRFLRATANKTQTQMHTHVRTTVGC